MGPQVREFWHELEAATNARQAALFEALNRQLERLARRIEAVVGDALDVTLEPAALAIAPPTPEQFHADLRELFSAGAPARLCSAGEHESVVFKPDSPTILSLCWLLALSLI